MQANDPGGPKRSDNLTLNPDLVARAEALNLSTLAKEAATAALARITRAKFDAEIAKACRVHNHYLTEYGSLGDAVRAAAFDEV